MQVPSGSSHLLNKRFSILGFLVRSTVDQHPTVELDSLGTDYSTVPIPSHSTRTYVILLLDFSTKDLLTTSAVGTTTALTRLTHRGLLLLSATLAPLDDISSLSVGSALGQQPSQLLDSFTFVSSRYPPVLRIPALINHIAPST